MSEFNNCCNGNHKLKAVFSCGNRDESSVVRWCSICGAIVVDKEIDGHVFPGAIRNLMAPKLAVDTSKSKSKQKYWDVAKR